jgi:hypothetical protein
MGAGLETGALKPFVFQPDADGHRDGFIFNFDFAGHVKNGFSNHRRWKRCRQPSWTAAMVLRRVVVVAE